MNHDLSSQLRVLEITKIKDFKVPSYMQIPHTPTPLKYVQ